MKKLGRPGLPQSTKDEIVALREKGKTYSSIARKFSIHPQTVYLVCKKAGAVPSIVAQRDADKRVIGTLKGTIERLVKEIHAADERNANLVRQLDDLQEAFNKEKGRTWLDRLIGF